MRGWFRRIFLILCSGSENRLPRVLYRVDTDNLQAGRVMLPALLCRQCRRGFASQRDVIPYGVLCNPRLARDTGDAEED